MCINNLNPSNSLLHRAMISVLVQNLVNRKLPNTEKEIRFYQSILCREVVLHKTNIVLKISDILKYIEWMKDIDVDKLTYGNADLNPLPAVLSSLGYVDLEQAKISKILDVIATYNKVFPGNNLFLNVDFLSEKTVFNIHKLVVDSCESISSSKFMILLPVIYRMSGFFDLKDALEEGTDYERKSYDCSLLKRALAFHREEIALEDFVPSEVVLDCRFLKEPDQTLLKQLFLGCESLHLQNCNKYPFLKSVIAAVVEEKSFTTIKCQTLILGSISLRQKSEGHNVLLLASKAKKELTLTCSSINSRLNFEYLNFQTSLESLSLVFPKNRVPLIFLRKILEIAPQLTQLNLNFKSANLTHEHIDLIRQIFEKAKKLKSLTLAGIAVDISNCINVLPKSLSKLHYVCPIGTNIQKVMLVLEEFENLHDLTLWAYKATGLVFLWHSPFPAGSAA